MTVANFKIKVAAYLNRAPDSFVVSGFDLLLDAINDAKREAQQKVNFARAFQTGFVAGSPTGVLLSTAKDAPGAGNALNFRVVTSCWDYAIDGSGLVTKYRQIDMIRESDLRQLIPFTDEQWTGYNNYLGSYPYANPPGLLASTSRRAFFQPGSNKIFVTGAAIAAHVLIQGYILLPDYVDAGPTDFFLDNYHSYLLWASLDKLNGYLKEDQRVIVSQRKLEDAWFVVMNDNDNIRDSFDTSNALN